MIPLALYQAHFGEGYLRVEQRMELLGGNYHGQGKQSEDLSQAEASQMPTYAGDKTERSQMNTLAKREGNRAVVGGGEG